MGAKRPSFQFYPADWIRDSVSGCSLAAQGLWLRMMILAHDSDRYGHLAMNGAAMPPEHIAHRCGCPLETYATLLAELSDAGVTSRSPEGIIYSRRMVRDERARILGRKNGKKGGNPVLQSGLSPGVNPPLNSPHEDEEEDNTTKLSRFEMAQQLYELYPKHVGKADAMKAIGRALSKERFDALRVAVVAYASARHGEDQKFTPNPSTWFNQERWNDDQATWRPSAKVEKMAKPLTAEQMKTGTYNPLTGEVT